MKLKLFRMTLIGIFTFFIGLQFSFADSSSHRKLRAQSATKKKNHKKIKQKKASFDRHALHQKYLAIMKAEMTRYMKHFAKLPHPKVYYLAYRMFIQRKVELTATDGHITGIYDNRKSPIKKLDVRLRVGSHKFDQTGKDGYDWRIYRSLLSASSYCPMELKPVILKKMLWRLTDVKYRVAFGQYWRKSYVRSLKPKIRDKAGDFSVEPPTIYMAPLKPKFTFDKKHWKNVLRRVSAITKHMKSVISSSIYISGNEKIILGVANDGSLVRLRKYSYNWGITITYLNKKTKEMMRLSDSGFAKQEKDLPSEKVLLKKFKTLLFNIYKQLNSPEGDPDVGPAIVDPYIAGAMFYDILMVRLETGRFLRKRSQRVFANKMGQLIIPSFLTVIDDPTLTHWKGVPLSSHYLYDDEWVRARRLVMIENGILKNFYLSRKPYKNYKHSNGHGRAAFGYAPFSRPGTTIIRSSRALPLPELKKQLIKEIRRQGRRYGYILKKFRGYSNVRRGVYRVTPELLYRLDIKTGKLTLLKGLQVQYAALQVIRGILATGNDYTVFNGSDSEDSGFIPITTVAPSLLIKRLAFQRIQLSEKRDYQLPPPFKPLTLQQLRKKELQRSQKKTSCPPADLCRRCALCHSNHQ